jgi:hypothetical protein
LERLNNIAISQMNILNNNDIISLSQKEKWLSTNTQTTRVV